jgi:hypothetical protein
MARNAWSEVAARMRPPPPIAVAPAGHLATADLIDELLLALDLLTYASPLR